MPIPIVVCSVLLIGMNTLFIIKTTYCKQTKSVCGYQGNILFFSTGKQQNSTISSNHSSSAARPWWNTSIKELLFLGPIHIHAAVSYTLILYTGYTLHHSWLPYFNFHLTFLLPRGDQLPPASPGHQCHKHLANNTFGWFGYTTIVNKIKSAWWNVHQSFFLLTTASSFANEHLNRPIKAYSEVIQGVMGAGASLSSVHRPG